MDVCVGMGWRMTLDWPFDAKALIESGLLSAEYGYLVR